MSVAAQMSPPTPSRTSSAFRRSPAISVSVLFITIIPILHAATHSGGPYPSTTAQHAAESPLAAAAFLLAPQPLDLARTRATVVDLVAPDQVVRLARVHAPAHLALAVEVRQRDVEAVHVRRDHGQQEHGAVEQKVRVRARDQHHRQRREDDVQQRDDQPFEEWDPHFCKQRKARWTRPVVVGVAGTSVLVSRFCGCSPCEMKDLISSWEYCFACFAAEIRPARGGRGGKRLVCDTNNPVRYLTVLSRVSISSLRFPSHCENAIVTEERGGVKTRKVQRRSDKYLRAFPLCRDRRAHNLRSLTYPFFSTQGLSCASHTYLGLLHINAAVPTKNLVQVHGPALTSRWLRLGVCQAAVSICCWQKVWSLCSTYVILWLHWRIRGIVA